MQLVKAIAVFQIPENPLWLTPDLYLKIMNGCVSMSQSVGTIIEIIKTKSMPKQVKTICLLSYYVCSTLVFLVLACTYLLLRVVYKLRIAFSLVFYHQLTYIWLCFSNSFMFWSLSLKEFAIHTYVFDDGLSTSIA